MNRGGQFYLLAAIVIVAVIIGVAGVSNYSKKKTNAKLIDLGEELGIEGGNVLEHGIYHGNGNKIGEFSEKYNDYAGEGKDLYFIFGDEDKIFVLTYEEIFAGNFCVGEVCNPQNIESATTFPINPSGGSEIRIKIDENEYTFDLKPGENFYFVISQEIEGEQYVVTN